IVLSLNSPGGSPGAALAVYDTMQHIRPDVATTCVGQAGGPGAVLLAGGAKGRRAILPHGKVTLHQPSTQGRGTVPDLILHADEVLRVRAELEAALAVATGRGGGGAGGGGAGGGAPGRHGTRRGDAAAPPRPRSLPARGRRGRLRPRRPRA